ncbi:hypothetical protein E2320_022311, partial [Naja naja]
MAKGRNLGALECECKFCRGPCVKLSAEQQASQRVPRRPLEQKGRSTNDLVLEFRHLTTNLRHWSQRLLVRYFQESLGEELLKICLCHSLPEDRIYD